MIVLAIANQKGGVGKTTTAVNLAAGLSVAERRTLLIDLDPQGNASTGVGVAPGSVDGGSYLVLLGQRRIEDEIRPTEIETLSILPATQDLVAIERELADDPEAPLRLRGVLADYLARCAENSELTPYDYVVLDCPPSLGTLTLNALVAASGVVVPLQCEYYALEGLSQLAGTIERVRALNETLDVHGVVLTMYDGRNNLSREVADEVRNHFHVYESVVPRNIRLAEAPSHGKPVLLYDAVSRGSYAYLSLAREILDDIEGEGA